MSELNNLDQKRFSKDICKWYQSIKRDLPWRLNQDPYKVWISEIMLQQTQVKTVIPYFNRFMEQFPSIEVLALATEEKVLKAWEGLGYYSRARNIHTTAKKIVKDYDNVFPSDYETILSLKGIGSYTAGAISSIAFLNPIPAVDGNVMRVMSRVLDIWDDIAKPKTKKKFELLLKDVVPSNDPSSFNQGLMELGALICKPRSQKCFECPVRTHCISYHNGYDDQLPIKSSKAKQKKIPMITGIVTNEQGKFLMRRRPEKGLLANMWEFVQAEGLSFNELQYHLFYHYNIKLTDGIYQGDVKHVFSHRIWNMTVYSSKVTGEPKLPVHLKFLSKAEIEQIPVSTAHKKVMNYIQ
ncbi:A/G-specific adenine glycosylase [Haloplasma contractile]|uniref:Adenine DNA glycosylase n=1 Tax=Haloplasma contractile SSD-17B TaxID=1033810 RepID=U2EF50_9MOLU|nr:A/G-specific adenine glycosylase [Haloplasma contractile]ERJ13553.1 putative A-G-specific adenine glycosylase YfhQ protein [Haloplasma contractile SSD-17B]